MRANKPLLHGDITASIIDSFFEVHNELGFGFREYIYTHALERLLIAKGHKVEREVAVMVYFRGEPLAYERMDMLVDGAVVIENKAREPLDPDAQGQLFAGLAATNLEVGLVLHFGKKRASIASSSKIGSSNETSSACSCRCRAVSVDRSIAVSRERCLCDEQSIANVDRRVPQVSDREMCFGMRCGV